jgi:hypothetical protein
VRAVEDFAYRLCTARREPDMAAFRSFSIASTGEVSWNTPPLPDIERHLWSSLRSLQFDEILDEHLQGRHIVDLCKVAVRATGLGIVEAIAFSVAADSVELPDESRVYQVLNSAEAAGYSPVHALQRYLITRATYCGFDRHSIVVDLGGVPTQVSLSSVMAAAALVMLDKSMYAAQIGEHRRALSDAANGVHFSCAAQSFRTSRLEDLFTGYRERNLRVVQAKRRADALNADLKALRSELVALYGKGREDGTYLRPIDGASALAQHARMRIAEVKRTKPTARLLEADNLENRLSDWFTDADKVAGRKNPRGRPPGAPVRRK